MGVTWVINVFVEANATKQELLNQSLQVRISGIKAGYQLVSTSVEVMVASILKNQAVEQQDLERLHYFESF